ncbi:YqgE/AlgH family protein [Tessaracoccus sp. SD287]|uniref:YqgE/AlgH family protein n=1 Tax=Tessaracoccus sp. SD287 TaxID=2782008 RepID=UPI001A961E34|nr:YqgE/AlgH family protein [Tessaracoccus sp. SD287]
MGHVTMPAGPSAGELLVATAAHGGGYFKQSVIYLLDADESGALGVVLNRLAPADLEEVLPQWSELVSPPRVLFAGGPVSPNGAVCVARLLNPHEDPPGWRRVRGDIGLLHLDTPVEIAEGAYSDLRIFAGYAGWEAGQLEGEMLQGSWHRFPSTEADVFGSDQEDLWRRVLRRQGGETAWYSTWTEDPELN